MGLDVHPATREQAVVCLRGIVGALTPGGGALEPVQLGTLRAIATELWDCDLDPAAVKPAGPEEVAAALAEPWRRHRLVQLMVTLELLLHPLPRRVGREVARYARELGVDEPTVHAARRLAAHQTALMYACIQRNSWYPAQTRREIRHGELAEVVRSKLAYYGLGHDERLARRWRALGGCPEGSWGRGVFDFYRDNGFPFPGEPHGIYEVGARHDWVHVLTDYGTSPEGEIDVFAFIAAAMPDTQGFILLVVTLGIFQNGSIRHMFGKRVPCAGTDALAAELAPRRFADALRRGEACTVDVLGLDHFAHAREPLAAVRERFNVLPRGG
jgi:hypothetical protein